MVEAQKIIVFLFVLLLLFYMIRLLISTKQNRKFKTYPFVVLIGGLILLTIATFLDIFAYIKNYQILYIIIRVCFTLGAIIYVIGVILWSDFTHKMIKQLEYITLYDPMTGILNRNGLEIKYNIFIKSKNCFYIIFCDLDGTKKINDSLGHLVGDKYINITTEIMKDIIGLKGHVARFGGDEFVILLEYVDNQELQLILLKIRQAVYKFLSTENTGISFGYSLFPNDGVTFEELIKIADKKMYVNKQRKK